MTKKGHSWSWRPHFFAMLLKFYVFLISCKLLSICCGCWKIHVIVLFGSAFSLKHRLHFDTFALVFTCISMCVWFLRGIIWVEQMLMSIFLFKGKPHWRAGSKVCISWGLWPIQTKWLWSCERQVKSKRRWRTERKTGKGKSRQR